MAAFKLDAFLEQLDGAVLGDIKAGDTLRVVESDAGLACATADGGVVGLLPAQVAPQLRHGSFVATIRSLKRQDGAVAQLQVRLTRGEPPAGPGGCAARGLRQQRQPACAKCRAGCAASCTLHAARCQQARSNRQVPMGKRRAPHD